MALMTSDCFSDISKVATNADPMLFAMALGSLLLCVGQIWTVLQTRWP